MFTPLSRREWLSRTGCGFGALALAGLTTFEARAANPLAAKAPHFPARAKRIIFLFMQGGVSHVDSYDYKPRLIKDAGKQFAFDDARVLANTGRRGSASVTRFCVCTAAISGSVPVSKVSEMLTLPSELDDEVK